MKPITVMNADLHRPDHSHAIIRLLDEYARDDMGGGEGLSDYTRDHLITTLQQHHGVHIILAFVADDAVGLAVCFEGFSTFACKPLLNIHDIIVSPAYRGRGIAKQLLAHAEAIALGLGCCKLTLEVLEGNQRAQSVYRACGFAGYQLHPDQGQAWFWQKKLN